VADAGEQLGAVPVQKASGEAADVRLVDDAVLERVVQGTVASPVEIVVQDHAFGDEGVVPYGGVREIGFLSFRVVGQSRGEVPGAVGERLGIGIDEGAIDVEPETLEGFEGTVDAPEVEGARAESERQAMPDVACLVGCGVEGKFESRFRVVGILIQTKIYARRVSGEDGEVDAPRNHDGSLQEGVARGEGDCLGKSRSSAFYPGIAGKGLRLS
jgi:hypothetical protein